MKRIVKPKALKRGDVIGICAPASPALAPDALAKGIRYLEQSGYRVELGKYVRRKHGYLAGTDAQRAHDLNSLFANRHVKAIIALRGGYGCQRILPLLDYNLIRKNPKILVGYSDITVLSLALFATCGLVTFAGPMAAGDLARGLTGYAEELFWQSLASTKPIGKIKGTLATLKKGNAKGILLGGNLSLVAALCGTPFFPSLKNSILLLEEIGERPYRVDRLLHQLKLAGILSSAQGVLLGKFIDCKPEEGKPSLSLKQVFQDTFGENGYPVISNLHHGHIRESLTMPIGVNIRLRGTTSGTAEILESGVH
jgi:muramoyltetrapeptide carboxypeptidase